MGTGRAALLLAALATAVTAGGCGGDGTYYPAAECDHFVTTVRTSQSSYAPGQTVIVSVTQVNEGPACSGTPPEWCGTLHAYATVRDSAGVDVWDNAATRTVQGISSCPYVTAPGPKWPAHYSNTQQLRWSQDRCAYDETSQPGHQNLNCPGTQVPAGRYRIVGNESSAFVIITIS
jgi:hypothetical protein